MKLSRAKTKCCKSGRVTPSAHASASRAEVARAAASLGTSCLTGTSGSRGANCGLSCVRHLHMGACRATGCDTDPLHPGCSVSDRSHDPCPLSTVLGGSRSFASDCSARHSEMNASPDRSHGSGADRVHGPVLWTSNDSSRASYRSCHFDDVYFPSSCRSAHYSRFAFSHCSLSTGVE